MRQIARQLNRQYQMLNQCERIYHLYAKTAGLSDAESQLLYVAHEAPLDLGRPCTQKDMCETWAYSKQTVNSAIKKLEQQGLLRLEALPGDGRNKAVVLTAAGEAVVREKILPLTELDRAALATLTDEERAEFLRLFHKYFAAFVQNAQENGLKL